MNTIINSDYVKKQINEITNLFSSRLIEDIARNTKFVKRKSKLTGTIFLSIFTLGMNIYQNPSLQQLIGLLNVIIPDFKLSRESLHERINEDAVKFFEFMLSQAFKISSTKIDLNLLTKFRRVLIIDSTLIELPEELSEMFKGHGGGASKSSVKIQFCYDLKLGKFFYLIQEGVSPDNKYDNSFVDKLNEYDLIIKDLGYFNPQAFIDMETKGVYYLSRWKSDTNIYLKDENNEIVSLDIEMFLTSVNSITEIEIYIKKGKQFSKARLVIEKVPEEVLNTRLRKLNRIAQKKGKTVRYRTKLLQGYNIFVSNIREKDLIKHNFRKLYGIRWQIELVFKNWKSNFNIDKISGFKIQRIKCMLYSRLLLIFISNKLIYQIRNICWLEKGKEISEIKASKHLNIIFPEILKTTIKNESNKIYSIFSDSITFIVRNCCKIKQKDRVYPLDLINSLALT